MVDMRSWPLILPFDGVVPRFATPPVFCGARSCVLGKVEIGASAWIGAAAAIRGDGHFIRLGDQFRIGARSTVHIAHDLYPTIVGDRVSVGRNAVVHACTVGDDCVIEDDAVILDGSVLAGGVLIEAGSVVFGRSQLASGFLYAGCPAKQIRAVDASELALRRERLHARAAEAAGIDERDCGGEDGREDVFIGRTARLAGRLGLGAGASVFFSCDLAAGSARIVVGENTNVQDNSVIACVGSGVEIGPDTTVGHNVRLADCRIGARALIGMGAAVAADTIIGDDVLLAAGATTLPGQVLESGWLWGGRPARAIAPLKATQRAMMSRTILQYVGYGRAYRALQLAAEREARAAPD